MISTVVVDDEVNLCEMLTTLLKNHCPDVEVVCVCTSAVKALKAIRKYHPQLVFLDVEMPEMTAFQLLDKIKPIGFKLILVCEHDKNTIDAIRYDALDYLLKPVIAADLIKAVEKVSHQLQITSCIPQLEAFLLKVEGRLNLIEKVALPTKEGLQMVAFSSIIYCMSNSNYTNFILKDHQKLNVCRTLKEVESILAGNPFVRVHHSYIVNLNEVKKYIKGEGGSIVMNDSTNINVSRSYKEQFLKKLQPGLH